MNPAHDCDVTASAAQWAEVDLTSDTTTNDASDLICVCAPGPRTDGCLTFTLQHAKLYYQYLNQHLCVSLTHKWDSVADRSSHPLLCFPFSSSEKMKLSALQHNSIQLCEEGFRL